MFIEINDIEYNSHYIQEFHKAQEDDGSGTTIYKIVYTIVNGSTIEETFDNESDRNSKYNSLLS